MAAEDDRVHNEESPSWRGRSSEVQRRDVVSRLGAADRLEPGFDPAGEQELHEALIASASLAFEQVLGAVDPFDLELLSRLYAVLLSDFRGENNLAFDGKLLTPDF